MSGGLVETSAPAKVILLGEHAVVFGQPAVSVAVGLRLRCHVRPAATSSLNGQPLLPQNYSYVSACLAKRKAGPTAVTTISDFPSGSGLGSSAAVTSALLAALATSQGGMDQATVAREAFEVESEVQGRASPIDTSTCTHGGGILVKRERGDGFLWEMSRDTRRWCVHDLKVPQMTLVIGFTGKSAPTTSTYGQGEGFVDHSTFARDIRGDRKADPPGGRSAGQRRHGRGSRQDRDAGHKLWPSSAYRPRNETGWSRPSCLFIRCKLTGAGGGGMVALTDRRRSGGDHSPEGRQPFITVSRVQGQDRIERGG